MTPDELAADLGITGKALRRWLRASYPRSPVDHGASWVLTADMVAAARARFGSSSVAAAAPAGISPPSDFEDAQAAFCRAPLHTRNDVLARPNPVPAEPGVYGWWFRELPFDMDTSGCLAREGHTLLYTGISPKRPPANGAPPSRQTLRDRIQTHYTGNAEGSTLRKTLGCLLAERLGIQLRRVGSGNRMTFVEGEQQLSEWMSRNALVSWVVDPQPWLLEEHLIRNLDVPLNLEGNAHNRFHRDLSAKRAEAVAAAKELPILPNPGVGGR